MALRKPDLCLATTTSPGTGDLLLDGTVPATRSFAQGIADGDLASGDTIKYKITTATQYEWGRAAIEQSGGQVWLRRATGTLVRSSTGARLDVPGGGVVQVFAAIPDADTLQAEDRSDQGGTIAVTEADNGFAADQTIASTDGGPAAGPALTLDRASASPAAADAIGIVNLTGRNAAAETVVFAALWGVIGDTADGVEDGELVLAAMEAGTLAGRLRIAGDGITTPSLSPQGAGTINAAGFFREGVELLPFSGAITYQLTAAVGVAAGQMVAMRADGRIQPAISLPQNTLASDDGGSHAVSACLPTEGRHVIVHTDSVGGDRDIVAYACTLDAEGAIGAGSKTDIHTTAASTPAINGIASDDANDLVVIAFEDGSSVHVVAMTVSGGTITPGTAVQIDSGDSCYLVPNCLAFGGGVFVLAYGNITGSDVKAIAFTVSGTTISTGSSVVIDPVNDAPVVAYDPGAGRFVVAWDDGANLDMMVLTLAGTAITTNTIYTPISSNSYVGDIELGFDPASTKLICATRDGGSTSRAFTAAVSGTALSFGAALALPSPMLSILQVLPLGSTGRILILSGNASGSWLAGVEVEVAGTDLVQVGTALIDGAGNNPHLAHDPDLGIVSVVWQDGADLLQRAFHPGIAGGSGHDLRAAFLGAPQAGIAAGNAGAVAFRGSIDENQSGLTPGRVLYLAADGTLTGAQNSYRVGRAVAAGAIFLEA